MANKKCTFVRFSRKTGIHAAQSRPKSTKESRAKSKKIKKDKLKRLREFQLWWR